MCPSSAGTSSAGRISSVVMFKKLFARVTIVIDRGLVDGDKGERFRFADVHRTRIRIKQEAILFVLFLQRDLGLASLRDIANHTADAHVLAVRVALQRDDAFQMPQLAQSVLQAIGETNGLEGS